MSVIEDLKSARSILAERGRTQSGNLIDHDSGRVCLLGAIGIAVHGNKFEYEPYFTAIETGRAGEAVSALAEFVEYRDAWNHEDYEHVYAFNDDTKTKDKDVFDLIDETVAYLEVSELVAA